MPEEYKFAIFIWLLVASACIFVLYMSYAAGVENGKHEAEKICCEAYRNGTYLDNKCYIKTKPMDKE